jgi:hypothetical protein
VTKFKMELWAQVLCRTDIRLKKDIQDSGAALPDLQDMRIRDFTLRATDERRTGVSRADSAAGRRGY